MGNCLCPTPREEIPDNPPPAAAKGGNTGADKAHPKTDKHYSLPPPGVGQKKERLTHIGTILQRHVEDLAANYKLGQELGRGQFGVTRQATHLTSGEKFACKSISKSRKILTKEDAEDVRREIAIMYHLQGHPNIVNLVSSYEDKANVHLLMEVCSGGELFDRIVDKGHYSEKAAAGIFRSILKVIAQCHALGVMHRDLKPENFLLSCKGDHAVIKATDFGLSVFFKPGDQFRDIVGSAYYVAPEVLKRKYSCEADVWSAGVILYILLCGVPPFWGESEQGIFQAVLKGHYDMKKEPWNKVSASAKDLVSKLLKPNPAERLTAHGALQHPWVREGGDAPDTLLDDTVVLRMKKFSDMNRLKKMALKVIAANLSYQEIEGLSEMFKSFDKDNSQTITLDELRQGLNSMGNKLNEKDLQSLMESADVDGDGTISYEEFITATVHMNKLNSEENLWTAFQAFDEDNSGYITYDELKKALQKFGMPETNIEEMIKECDKDGDGQIDYGEFVLLMRSNNGPPGGLNIGDLQIEV
mmetsp:Transcript_38456/g.46397  ORF Transcript_38456/g.46397 Transcript_38456/m.46397 type:complete len:529 (-) Transcript_38456:888-2474(-)|eukprot:CAMPEP_0197850444 /NCGR_PEP_ID=MMETSP1438-20131217/15354_1 /TAXON_ID=1461541 /ORGANISM="Pterosperma sp., Strain CCMP1384" /LENGTH=528 /DNA_ID=CAMNT_0043463601 /DNA_START=360 /DNA_END=1946 /DNA_ORIENTATION=+